jgi:uncharacterized protein YndB with AHSA1/START domain
MSTMKTTIDQATFTITFQRAFTAPREDVFEAWTRPEQLAEWWGPEGFVIPSLDFPARTGEPYRIEMQPPEGDAFFLAGDFRQVDPPTRLVFTFRWEDPDPDDVENIATLWFVDLGDSTEVGLVQAPFRTEARLALHRDGWGDSFDKLERLIR